MRIGQLVRRGRGDVEQVLAYCGTTCQPDLLSISNPSLFLCIRCIPLPLRSASASQLHSRPILEIRTKYTRPPALTKCPPAPAPVCHLSTHSTDASQVVQTKHIWTSRRNAARQIDPVSSAPTTACAAGAAVAALFSAESAEGVGTLGREGIGSIAATLMIASTARVGGLRRQERDLQISASLKVCTNGLGGVAATRNSNRDMCNANISTPKEVCTKYTPRERREGQVHRSGCRR